MVLFHSLLFLFATCVVQAQDKDQNDDNFVQEFAAGLKEIDTMLSESPSVTINDETLMSGNKWGALNLNWKIPWLLTEGNDSKQELRAEKGTTPFTLDGYLKILQESYRFDDLSGASRGHVSAKPRYKVGKLRYTKNSGICGKFLLVSVL